MLDQVDNQGLDLPVNVKPRIEWTKQLHERFVQAITQLGGDDKATPESIMRLMGVPGLTPYHLKRHLQKYKLSKYGTSSSASGNKRQVENYMVAESRIQDDQSPYHTNESMLQIQVNIQRNLEAQIEVQKHLQLRIEAQGKYLQSALSKANEIIAGCRSSYIPVETAKAELLVLASAMNIGCLSSSFSHGGIIPEKTQIVDCLLDSCSTSEKTCVNTPKIEACFSSLLAEEGDEIDPEDCKAG